ncbi:hypothetical protein E2C01_061377 [Portunus trituberculatus]|uniref:Uncharacterized protein n=1 Tax=Portunus trituberculatus TaxID=210409 RepID=A0A5B7HE78_PORTR|nr:hypothetical protein [Portunus trituberculatus]
MRPRRHKQRVSARPAMLHETVTRGTPNT